MNERETIIEAHDLWKSFEGGRIPALNGVELTIKAGEFVAIVGPSGCGKSTLLHLIGALDRPTRGTIVVKGHDLSRERNLSAFRSREIGLIFQLHNLLPALSASENVQVPMLELPLSARQRRQRALQLLEAVGISQKERSRPTQLSGGERQRVAVARALANDPSILLADEPTGSLDSESGRRVLDLLEQLRAERNLTIILVTHDLTIAQRAERIIRMLDGRVVDDGVDQTGILKRLQARTTATSSLGIASEIVMR